MATRKQKLAAEAEFADLANAGVTPEAFILKVMRGTVKITRNNKDRYNAALALLPYRLPRLNSVDATTRNVGLTHDEWIKQMEGEVE